MAVRVIISYFDGRTKVPARLSRAANPLMLSRTLHACFNNLLINRTADPSKHMSVLDGFFTTANKARTPEEKGFIIKVINDALRIHHPPTITHQETVRKLSIAIGKCMGLPLEQIQMLELAAYIHDIGKFGMTAELLDRLGILPPDDVARIRIHVDIAIDILSRIKWMPKDVIEAVRFHHYYKLYPSDIRPEDAPLLARILAIADCFDKMTTPQTYKSGKGVMSYEEAIADFRGSKYPYDQSAVDALEMLVKMNKSYPMLI